MITATIKIMGDGIVVKDEDGECSYDTAMLIQFSSRDDLRAVIMEGSWGIEIKEQGETK